MPWEFWAFGVPLIASELLCVIGVLWFVVMIRRRGL